MTTKTPATETWTPETEYFCSDSHGGAQYYGRTPEEAAQARLRDIREMEDDAWPEPLPR